MELWSILSITAPGLFPDPKRFTVLRSITRLRQLSLHPGLPQNGHDGVPCAKLSALTGQLEEVVGGGHRALGFR